MQLSYKKLLFTEEENKANNFDNSKTVDSEIEPSYSERNRSIQNFIKGNKKLLLSVVFSVFLILLIIIIAAAFGISRAGKFIELNYFVL